MEGAFFVSVVLDFSEWTGYFLLFKGRFHSVTFVWMSDWDSSVGWDGMPNTVVK